MAIVSSAIVLSFHLKSQPSEVELKMAKPLGVVFWALSVACLLLGVMNYISEFSLSPSLSPSTSKSSHTQIPSHSIIGNGSCGMMC